MTKSVRLSLFPVYDELRMSFSFSQVQLQNLITSKYIGHFLEEVSLWQKKLSVSDSVISIWFEVQRTWSHLESIFIGSEDIRNQLPEDSKRFDGIDVDFKVSAKSRHFHRILIASFFCGVKLILAKLQWSETVYRCSYKLLCYLAFFEQDVDCCTIVICPHYFYRN